MKEETPIEFIERKFVDADGKITYNEQVKGYLEGQFKRLEKLHDAICNVLKIQK